MTTQQELIYEVVGKAPMAKACPKCGTSFEFYRGWRLKCVRCGGESVEVQRRAVDARLMHPSTDVDAITREMAGHYLWSRSAADGLPAVHISAAARWGEERASGCMDWDYYVRCGQSLAGASYQIGPVAPTDRLLCQCCFYGSGIESYPTGHRPAIDLGAVRRAMKVRFVWFTWGPNEIVEENDDVEVHRIVEISLGWDGREECIVYYIPHRRGVHDNYLKRDGHVQVEVGVDKPSGKSLCKICFPEGYRDTPSAE